MLCYSYWWHIWENFLNEKFKLIQYQLKSYRSIIYFSFLIKKNSMQISFLCYKNDFYTVKICILCFQKTFWSFTYSYRFLVIKFLTFELKVSNIILTISVHLLLLYFRKFQNLWTKFLNLNVKSKINCVINEFFILFDCFANSNLIISIFRAQ